MDASYTLLLSENDRLSLGLKGGTSFYTNNLAEGLTPSGEVYETTTGSYPNIGLGTYYYNRNIYVGLSIPYMLETPKFRLLNTDDTNGLSKNFNVFPTTGGRFKLTEDVICKPSTLLKYSLGLPLSIDINANFLYKTLFEAGVSYRYNDSMSGMVAVIINENMRIGYAYDSTLTNLGRGLSSHEIVLHFDLNFRRDGRWLTQPTCYF